LLPRDWDGDQITIIAPRASRLACPGCLLDDKFYGLQARAARLVIKVANAEEFASVCSEQFART